MKKMILAGVVSVCGCLTPVDPQQPPLAAGSRILGLNMSGSWKVRDETYDAAYANVQPELGFLFADNVALIFTPLFSSESQKGSLSWRTSGLLIAGDYTFYQPGKNVHAFAGAHIGFADVKAEDDSLGVKDDGQGFVLGAGGGVRMFHSSNCSVDIAFRYTLVAAELETLDVKNQGHLWLGFSVKLYFPVQRVLQTR